MQRIAERSREGLRKILSGQYDGWRHCDETKEFATEEEESSEEVADESNMAAALLLVDRPES